MSGTINKSNNGIIPKNSRQSCVRIVRKSSLPLLLKAETEKFIERNTLPDCGMVPPNCLKAFMINTAQKMGLNRIIPYVKTMFKAKIGYEGYYLDRGQLFRVDLVDNSS
jgi:hypothetical protein